MQDNVKALIEQELVKHLLVIEEFLKSIGVDETKSVVTILVSPEIEVVDDYITDKAGVLLLSTREESEIILDQLDCIRDGIITDSSFEVMDIEDISCPSSKHDEDHGESPIEDLFADLPKSK